MLVSCMTGSICIVAGGNILASVMCLVKQSNIPTGSRKKKLKVMSALLDRLNYYHSENT